jgi:hypothetical protein
MRVHPTADWIGAAINAAQSSATVALRARKFAFIERCLQAREGFSAALIIADRNRAGGDAVASVNYRMAAK